MYKKEEKGEEKKKKGESLLPLPSPPLSLSLSLSLSLPNFFFLSFCEETDRQTDRQTETEGCQVFSEQFDTVHWNTRARAVRVVLDHLHSDNERVRGRGSSLLSVCKISHPCEALI